jgi:hypothetical protein
MWKQGWLKLGYVARAHQQLKAEEEAARPTVDAYNACKRLKALSKS